MKEVVVTGGRGKIGRWVVARLRKEGWRVELMEHGRGLLEDLKRLKDYLRGVKYVVHLAGYQNPSDRNYNNFYQTNVVGTLNLLKAVDRKTIKKIVYFSSWVVKEPLRRNDWYGRSKLEAYKLVKDYRKLPIKILLPSIVVGIETTPPPRGWQRLVWKMAGGFPGAVATFGKRWREELLVINVKDLAKRVVEILEGKTLEPREEVMGCKMRVGEYRKLWIKK